MKKILLIAVLVFAAPIATLTVTSCTSSQQVIAYKSLAAVGETAETTMKEAARARHDGQITDAQWQEIKRVHDTQFIPAFNLAVDAAASSSSVAPQQIVDLAARLTSLLAQYLPTPL